MIGICYFLSVVAFSHYWVTTKNPEKLMSAAKQLTSLFEQAPHITEE